jgi:SpoVK/Ycf46/Vps4 family AAA+-type ATPase
LVAPGAVPVAPAQDPADAARREIDRLVSKRKREILERECFGLVEFVEPEHGFEVVGGMEEVKKDLLVIAESIREGRTSRVPMGILFTGPMGTGKTFVAEAFA